MIKFFKELWKKKGQWQVWFRIALIPFLIPFVIVVDLGRRCDIVVEYVVNNAPKPK